MVRMQIIEILILFWHIKNISLKVTRNTIVAAVIRENPSVSKAPPWTPLGELSAPKPPRWWEGAANPSQPRPLPQKFPYLPLMLVTDYYKVRRTIEWLSTGAGNSR